MIPVRIPPAEMAREACSAMSDSQKVAFAIELSNCITDPRQAAGLLRLGRLATHAGELMMRAQFEAECG
ncbi:hypothetical protein [Oceaniglobus trochenteri]|uniref:hypothetical protein n=1 Tax=Oceaniglobus trochenteri TaxID=2763260 RepID=UPI001D0003D2|nr:hypothetical protein [Oceaniglobus trochenteri]